MENNVNGLTFDPERHQYFYYGNPMYGVTSLIADKTHKKFPKNFQGISQIASATYKGSFIHELVSLSLEYKIKPKKEHKEARWIIDFLEKRYGNGFWENTHSEWLVTDFALTASAIDLAVELGNGEVDLYDIKTGEFKREYCSWQLGCYANMVEVSRGKKSRRCYVLSTKAYDDFVIIPKPENEVMKLLSNQKSFVEKRRYSLD